MSTPLTLQHTGYEAISTPGHGIELARGDVTKFSGIPGFARGCLFIDRPTAKVLCNTGTATVAAWTVIGAAPSAALTAVVSSTVDGTYGTEEQNVLNNVRTRVGEIEAALIAHGILSEPA